MCCWHLSSRYDVRSCFIKFPYSFVNLCVWFLFFFSIHEPLKVKIYVKCMVSLSAQKGHSKYLFLFYCDFVYNHLSNIANNQIAVLAFKLNSNWLKLDTIINRVLKLYQLNNICMFPLTFSLCFNCVHIFCLKFSRPES